MTQTPLRLTGFSKHATALIRQMESYGWTGRIGANHHAFMRAPDGVTSCSVVPKEGSFRHRGNQEMEFKAWLRLMDEMSAEAQELARQREEAAALARLGGQERFARMFRTDSVAPTATPPAPASAPVDTDPAPAPEPETPARSEFACQLCGREFSGRQPLAVHHVRAHVRVACPVCGREMAPGNLPRHQHAQHPSRPEVELQRETYQLRQEVARLRSEVSAWQLLAEEAEEAAASYTALRERHNALVVAVNELHSVLDR